MRVLVAGRNAKALAQAAGALSNDLTMATAASKAAALALLDHTEFDLVVACENLGDGSGLEVLSHVAVTTPNTLRIFAARPATLELLKGELGLFGLFRTLPYPINFRALWAALHLARSCSANPADPTGAVGSSPPTLRHVVLHETWDTGSGDIVVDDVPLRPTVIGQTVPAPMAAPAVASVSPSTTTTAVKASAATTANTTSKALAKAAASAATAKARAAAAATSVAKARNATHTPFAVGARDEATAHETPKSAGAVAAQGRPRAAVTTPAGIPLNFRGSTAALTASRAALGAAAPSHSPQPPPRIPESEAFKRALARRAEAKHRREPSVNNESLAQLARLSTVRRPPHLPRTPSRRTALFVGSGVFAAAAAVVLTFFMLRTNNSMPGSPMPLVASMDQGAPQATPPWSTAGAPPPQIDPWVRLPPVDAARPEAAAPTDMDVNAEAASEQPDVEPGHPGPPQPNPPPGPSEPPAYDASGMPVEQ
jgi:hypothetical protein